MKTNAKNFYEIAVHLHNLIETGVESLESIQSKNNSYYYWINTYFDGKFQPDQYAFGQAMFLVSQNKPTASEIIYINRLAVQPVNLFRQLSTFELFFNMGGKKMINLKTGKIVLFGNEKKWKPIEKK